MNRPYVWAHRGADKYAPENTLPAFAMAAEMGADGVELDVQLTKDGHVVVCHDERLERISNGKGWLKAFTLEELKSLDFSCGQEGYAGVQIATLEEVLDLLQDTGMQVNIELKTQVVPYIGLEKKCIDLVRKKGYEDRVIFSAFNQLSLFKVHRLARDLKVGYLYLNATPAVLTATERKGAYAIHVSISTMKMPGFLDRYRKSKIKINAWTINNEKDLQFCMEQDVNAIITDYPDKMKAYLDSCD